jgi:small-conductance mechanosensitive channel
VSSLKEVLPPTSLLEHLIKVLVFIIGGLVLLRSLGISITPALAGLGIGGLAVALALQGPLANFFSGIHLLLSKQIRIGDYIKLETGEEGYIVDITWRNTTIKQLSNNIVIIPNSKLASLIIVNYDQPEKELSIPINIGISYSSDLEKVERVTLEVAKEVMREVPGGVPEFEPVVRYHSFGEYSINFTVILRAKGYTDQFLIKHEFIKRLYLRYKKEGIEIPFPIRVIYLKEK